MNTTFYVCRIFLSKTFFVKYHTLRTYVFFSLDSYFWTRISSIVVSNYGFFTDCTNNTMRIIFSFQLLCTYLISNSVIKGINGLFTIRNKNNFNTTYVFQYFTVFMKSDNAPKTQNEKSCLIYV